MKKLMFASFGALALLGSFLTFDKTVPEKKSIFGRAVECQKVDTDEVPELGRPAYIPTDEYYSSNQYISMNHVGNIESVWNDYQGEGLTIAVIDSGIDYQHPDFYDENGNSRIRASEGRWYAHITSNPSAGTYTTCNSQTVSGSLSYFETTSGTYNIDGVKYQGVEILKHSLTWKYSSHGTNVAGTAAAFNHDTSHVGTIGIAPKAKILPIKVDFFTDSIGEALRYVYTLNTDSDSSNDVHVVNISIESSTTYATITEFVNKLTNIGTIIVAAAGNSSTSTPSYPAAEANVIGVGALDRDSSTSLASYSNYNSTTASSSTSTNNTEVVTPGHVYAPNYTGSHTYVETHGTSFASPIVAGAALLWREVNPNKTFAEFRTKLHDSCIDIGSSGWDYQFGYGRLDIEKLVSHPTDIVFNNTEIVDSELELKVGDYIDLDWTVNGYGPFNNSVNFSIYSGTNEFISVTSNGRVTAIAEGEDIVTITCTTDSEVKNDILVSVKAAEKILGTYTIGWGTASGTTGTYANFAAISGSVTDLFSFSSAKNNATNDPAYNSSSNELRLYYNSQGKGGSITITPNANVTITGFVMTTSTNPTVKYKADSGTLTTVSCSSYTYSVTGIEAKSSLFIQNANTTNTQLRIKKIAISYSIKTLTSIEVSTAPNKIEYDSGEFFNPAGLVIRRNYSDNTNDTYSYADHTSEFSFSPTTTTALTTSNSSITITYSGFTCTQAISVNATKTLSSISISGYTTEFVEGDSFSFGGAVTAHFSDSSSSNVTASATFEGYNMTLIGNSSVTVSYTYGGTTKTQSYQITISQGTLSSIDVNGMTTQYQKNYAFSFDGTCNATFANGYEKTVTPTSVSSPDMKTAGNKTITVSYTYNGITKETTYDITVNSNRTVIEEVTTSDYSVIGTVTWSSATATISPSNCGLTVTKSTNGTTYESSAMKLGSNKYTGTVTVSSNSTNITKVVVSAKYYGSDSSHITVGGDDKALTSSYADYLKEYTTATNSVAISTTTTGKRAYVQSVILYETKTSTVETDISSSEDCQGLETFIDTYLHMDYVDNLGYCKDSTHHYYSSARDAFNNLNDHQRSLFTSNSAYLVEWTRLSTWASINDEALNGDNELSKSKTGLSPILIKDQGIFLVVVIFTLVSVASISGLYVIKKRKSMR